MIFSIDADSKELNRLHGQSFSDLGLLERQDLQEWVIEEPRILGEELLIIASEYQNFEQTRNRLDVLALDTSGQLVVIELKRDRADETTDLQAIKYASYCATLTAEDIQSDYRQFWNSRREEELSPEEVGEQFASFLDDSVDTDIEITSEGWADFDLDDKPRIILLAGSFGIEITAPVTWLIEEYGMEIACIRVEAYKDNGRILLNSQQVIPVPEAEEYMARRREKQERQQQSDRRRAAIHVLLESRVLVEGDIVEFCSAQKPPREEWQIDPPAEFWQAQVTGQTGRSNNVEWLYDGEEYSFTGVSKEILNQLVDRPHEKALNGYQYWCHPEFESRTLSDLRNSGESASERKEL
ncbi:endonuclease NucS domain-containing protein [Halalkalicoccus subterraneus]|uniref:endonuclease NucS domain-containing protein n=1 Tax=Halalkalicoccus subterraneus TaxID=2675002 RepID=UPI000EFB2BD3|nr:endonuclease NucS domain-containing protein [Halalkalicoccus subterraneus]